MFDLLLLQFQRLLLYSNTLLMSKERHVGVDRHLIEFLVIQKQFVYLQHCSLQFVKHMLDSVVLNKVNFGLIFLFPCHSVLHGT